MARRVVAETKSCANCLKVFSRRKASGGLYHVSRWQAKLCCSNYCHLLFSWSRRKESVEDRFWRQVAKRQPSQCWLWQGAQRCGKGYGGFHYQGKKMERAHRMAWKLTHGEIADGLVVMHRCDNPPCCNPHHLQLGSIADNNRDRDARGRHVKINRATHHATKVSPAALVQLQSEYRALPRYPSGKVRRGLAAQLAARYNIALTHLCRITRMA